MAKIKLTGSKTNIWHSRWTASWVACVLSLYSADKVGGLAALLNIWHRAPSHACRMSSIDGVPKSSVINSSCKIIPKKKRFIQSYSSPITKIFHFHDIEQSIFFLQITLQHKDQFSKIYIIHTPIFISKLYFSAQRAQEMPQQKNHTKLCENNKIFRNPFQRKIVFSWRFRIFVFFLSHTGEYINLNLKTLNFSLEIISNLLILLWNERKQQKIEMYSFWRIDAENRSKNWRQ